MAPKRKSLTTADSTDVSAPSAAAKVPAGTRRSGRASVPVVANLAEDDDDEEDEDDEEEEVEKKVVKKAKVVKDKVVKEKVVKEKVVKEKVVKEKTAAGGVVGKVLDDIKLLNENDEEVSLKDLYEKSGLVIFSYPRANTPGCTTQACNYRDLHSEITALGYEIVGLSQDKPKAQLNWKTSKKFQYSFLCDPDRKLLKVLGATEAKKRCHWVVEKGGKVLEADIGVKPADDPKNALAFIKSLEA